MHPCCLSLKGLRPTYQAGMGGGSREPSIPAGESRKWPPIMRAIVEPYLMTRVLKWNKSAIKKRALAIENLLMREAVRGGPKRDGTMEHGGAPLIAFWPGFLFPTLAKDDRCWQEMATDSQMWTHTENYADTSTTSSKHDNMCIHVIYFLPF